MTEPETHEPIPQPDPDAEAVEAAEPDGPPPEPWTPERVSEWNAYYDVYVRLGVLLLVFIASANRITHSSIWPQLQAGRLIAAAGAPVTADPFSYTEAGRPWVNVPWLFEWSHAAVFKAAADLAPKDASDPSGSAARAEQVGAGALVAVAALVRLLTALVLLSVRRPGPGRWWSALCVMLALGAVFSPAGEVNGGIAGAGQVAPSTWGLLFFAVELFLLHRAADLGRTKAAYALAPLFALWANVDESFLIGLLVLAAWAVGRAVSSRRKGGAEGVSLPVALGALGASALACLANPSTFRVYAAAVEPFLGLFRPSSDAHSVDQLSYFSPEILKTPGAGWLIGYYAGLVAIGFGSFALNRRRLSPERLLVYVAAAVTWGALIRHGPEFAAVFAVTLALNGQEWYHDRFGTAGRLGAGWTFWSVGGRMVTIVVIFLGVAKALLGGLPVPGFGPSFLETRFGFGFDPDDFAFEAADFLKSASLSGQVLNTTKGLGDALDWRAYPDRKVFIDSRPHLFPPALFNRLQAVRKALSEDDVEGWKPALDEFKVSAVLIQPAGAPNTYRVLSQSPNWVPFYDDGNVVGFGRSDAPAGDLAFFKANRLEPDYRAYRRTKPAPPPDRPPSPVTWMDSVFQTRALARPQPHTEAARRWLIGSDADPAASAMPDPARCLLAVREARAALASKPDDTQAYRLLADAYRALMAEEAALLAGIRLTPENAARVAQVVPRPDLLMTRFRQRATALNYAIQTTPPPQDADSRHDLQRLNLELAQLFLSVNFLDLARDRFRAALQVSRPEDFSAEGRTQLSQQLAQIDEQVKKVQERMNDLGVEQQAGPVQLAGFAISQGAPGLAIHELEEAERTGTNPALVKPQLLDLYCDTGQPDKAVEMLTPGTVEDPQFGTEPGLSPMRQGRAYFLLGNSEYAATLWEKYAILRLRYDRAMRALGEAQTALKGEPQASVGVTLEIPEKIKLQANWEFEAGLCRLEGGEPDLAAEHFTKALTLAPKIALRPILVYYLEKLGKPVEAKKEAGASQ